MVPLGQCCQIVSGATPKTSIAEYWDGHVDWATPADLGKLDGAYIEQTSRKITAEGLSSCGASVLPVGSVLLSSRAPIGHVAINMRPMATNQGFKSLVPQPGLDAKYLYHWLRSNRGYLQSLGNGATFKELSKATVSRVEIPLPALDEQCRIAAILDQADALRDLRRQALARLGDLADAYFREEFNEAEYELSSIAETAEVRGGLQVSSKRQSLPVEVSYLRVANVYRNRLALKEIKTMRVTERERERTMLQDGDLLVVEGHGNPEEVGRVAVWNADVTPCVHQNHLIRVRFDRRRILPEFGAAWLNSRAGRRHLLRSAKTTSGLNTISSSNVKSAPIPLVALDDQERFVRQLAASRRAIELGDTGLQELDDLVASLQARAFSGQL